MNPRRNVREGSKDFQCNYDMLCPIMVAPPGLFQVKTGSYMPNNFKAWTEGPLVS